MKRLLCFVMLVLLGGLAFGADSIARDPYIGAIVVDASDGRVLFEDGADRPGYPASMLKLVDLFVILDLVKVGSLSLDEVVAVTQEAASMGGSQVWLDPRESFPLEELLYALMVQSANDAAMALAIHVGGSREGFVRMMNDKARALGLSGVTRFQSPHGLPPPAGVRPDMTTPRDFAKLCQALLAEHPNALQYTSVSQRPFRTNAPQPMMMGNHNELLGNFPGCDGLKTGWIRASGYCLAATVARDERRVITVIMGSETKKTNIAKTKELVNRWLPEATRVTKSATASTGNPKLAREPGPVKTKEVPAGDASAKSDEASPDDETPAAESSASGGWLGKMGYVLLGAFLAVVVGLAVQRRLLVR